ncbi:hypothetical protein EZS27_013679 [termite gut metagenome]|uniref:Uncharacterized protein n=1 Tax=termite gut metagenome TaxID=433724 RepID=A0A5J4RZ94_9ZZZZ
MQNKQKFNPLNSQKNEFRNKNNQKPLGIIRFSRGIRQWYQEPVSI